MTIDELPEGLKEGDAVEVDLNKRLAMTLMPGKYLFEFVEVSNNIVVLRDSIAKNKWEPYFSELDSVQILEPKKFKCVWTVGPGKWFRPSCREKTLPRTINNKYGNFCPFCGGEIEVKDDRPSISDYDFEDLS